MRKSIPLPPKVRLVYLDWIHKHAMSVAWYWESLTLKQQENMKKDYEDWKNGTGGYDPGDTPKWIYWLGEST